ncbi:Crp/Fnr family transcriptional regulator [Methylobacterium sp. J-076]|uniref:Crp/Fnr family transcriptional regulator n=1 Tax=Methylobacterium sp. J-076 TaxID=2836655 RepID=UPI001FB8E6E4|nr:Crp/Fnr family transcriptional regulator [Methylobacterium sp. J-076]MCJ2012215.1 Crp/Fnr family transcriptional regulator [Methylobacterium sp. J-076]
MSEPMQDTCANRLLRSLHPDDFALLQGHVRLATLAVGDVLIRPDTAIPQVAFVEQGIVSLIGNAPDGERIEVGLVGFEGLVGTPVLLGAGQTPNEAKVQALGLAHVMPAEAFGEVLRKSPRLHRQLLCYVHVLSVQIASTALANGRYKLPARVARWLLMCHDRTDGDELPTTHRFLSLMLGVQRPGLTAAISALERSGLIQRQRGILTIRDRESLLKVAGASYGVPEAEYARLIASPGRAAGPS